jgi:hypothetical protein
VKRSEAAVIIGYAGTAIVQVAWHWFLTSDGKVAQALLRFYLSYDPKVGKGVAGWLDLILPATCLGMWIGFVGCGWSFRKLACFVILGAILIAGLAQAYPKIMHLTEVWWWYGAGNPTVAVIIRQFIQTLLALGAFVYGGRELGIYRMKATYP